MRGARERGTATDVCGIAGVLFHRDDEACPRRGRPPPAFTRTLRDVLQHRGPDGDGVFVDDGVALVHTRLALVDVEHGRQPMSTPDGRFTLVVNGEIYGHRRLRPLLETRGAIFRTHSDSEVLLWALALALLRDDDEPPRTPVDIEGEYAFCLWDARARRAVLGRDPLGVKPLVWAHHDGAIWFASELKALTAVLPSIPLDPGAAASTFAAPALSGGDVPFLGAHAFPRGVSPVLADLRAADRTPVQVRLRRPDRAGPAPPRARDIAGSLERAVAERLDADVPVGAFLSGGVDSSAIVAAALRARRDAMAGEGGRLRCYSIRFDDDPGTTPGSIVVGDDAPYSELLAERWPIELVRVQASRRQLVDDLEDLTASQDRIVAWEQELSQRALAQAASRDVSAILVGDAADETHYGYAFALDRSTCASPRALAERFGFSARRGLVRQELRWLVDERLQHFDARTVDAFTADDGSHGALRRNRRAMAALLRERWLTRLLHNGDMHTMAFGLEARVPFADSRVVTAADLVDVDAAFREDGDPRGPEKAALRDAVAPWLPPEIVARRKSALPRDEGLGHAWRDRCRALLAEPVARERLALVLDVDAVDAFVTSCESVDDEKRAILFSVIGMEGFLRHHGPR